MIRVTSKLQKEMGLKKSDLPEEEPQFSYFGSCHSNLLHISGKKCVLFTNDRTLFSFLIPDITRSQIRLLSHLFREHLEQTLSEKGFAVSTIAKILSEYSEIRYSKSNSKIVLGCMIDFAWHYKYLILESGGIDKSCVSQIVKKLNRMPMSAIQYEYPINVFKDRVIAT